ncbi:hypothetical protein CRG98_046824 [Punica granatum]|uniref:Uncharacterized protein n=1 Tax=Punica granatum TaxID=22663 RepID=A0A2I0HND8_PUNGR|nr:hypothetical protein CRG98_046824 [Punica granatum]
MEDDNKAWMRRPWVRPWAPRVMREVRVSIDRLFKFSGHCMANLVCRCSVRPIFG